MDHRRQPFKDQEKGTPSNNTAARSAKKGQQHFSEELKKTVAGRGRTARNSRVNQKKTE